MYMLTLALQDGLTLERVLADVPHTPAAIVVYLILIASAVLIFRGSRSAPPPEQRGPDADR